MYDEKARFHLIDLLTGPLFAARDVPREMIDRDAEASTSRRSIIPEIHIHAASDLGEARQCFDVESAVMHRSRTLELDGLRSIGFDLPANSLSRTFGDLSHTESIADISR